MNIATIMGGIQKLVGVVPQEMRDRLEVLALQKARELGDDVLDAVEKAVEESETQIDDALVLPAIAALRDALEIPDDIGGDED